MSVAVAAPEAPAFGVGVYSFPAAARLVSNASAKRLRSWMRSGLTPPSYDRGGSPSDLLSFLDLISLEVVSRIRSAGVSLQKIRLLESELRRVRDVPRPFAHEVFFTDGADVWYQLERDDSTLVLATSRTAGNLAWRSVVSSFAEQIHYEDGRAAQWRPAASVLIDPGVQFGAPVVEGTRITVQTIVENLKAGTPDEVADWYDLEVGQVEAARAYDRAVG